MFKNSHNQIEQAIGLSLDVLAAALEYARQGIAVFPLHNPTIDGSCSCRKRACGSLGKHPRTANGVKAATTSEGQIRAWWIKWPDANIGIATGAVSGVMIVDVDGAEGEESLRWMTEKHGALPATRTAKTGRGRHLYFKHPGGKVKSKAPVCSSYPHVDSRGEGGYVVAPPSLHASGARYVADTTMPSELAEPPAWLIKLVSDERPPRSAPNSPQLSIVANDSFAEGSRNASLASLAGSMRCRGMTQEAIEAALLKTNAQKCDPPLQDAEVEAIARSIANYAPGTAHEVRRTLHDAGNATRFANQWGEDVRYVPELRQWLVWNDRYWRAPW